METHELLSIRQYDLLDCDDGNGLSAIHDWKSGVIRSRVRCIDSATWIAIAVGCVALGIGAYDLSLPNVLSGVHGVYGLADGYDDGVYLGVAVRLVHGAFPYRDFVYLQPPGIALLLSPLAAIGRAIGDRDALVIARLLTLLITGCNAFLVARILRSYGRTAVLVGGLALAIFPLSIAASSTLLLEPYLAFFCLAAISVLLSTDHPSRRRVFIGALLLGFAVTIKLWAILVLVGVVIAYLPKWRSDLRALVTGIVTGIVVPVLPFFIGSPHNFIHEVIETQFSRAASGAGGKGGAATSIGDRLAYMTGMNGIPNLHAVTGTAEFIGFVVVSAMAVAVIVLFRGAGIRARTITVASTLVFVGMFIPHDFYDHYAYFPGAFIALFIGFIFGKGRALLDARVRQLFGARQLLRVVLWSIAPFVAGVIVAVLVLGQETTYAASYLANAFDSGADVAAAIPAGSCVVTDQPTIVADADRLSASHTCPDDIDPLGAWLANDNGVVPPAPQPYPAAMVHHLEDNLLDANYVVLSIPESNYLPWTSSLWVWFNSHYTSVIAQQGTYVYVHDSDFSPTAQSG